MEVSLLSYCGEKPESDLMTRYHLTFRRRESNLGHRGERSDICPLRKPDSLWSWLWLWDPGCQRPQVMMFHWLIFGSCNQNTRSTTRKFRILKHLVSYWLLLHNTLKSDKNSFGKEYRNLVQATTKWISEERMRLVFSNDRKWHWQPNAR